MDSTWEPPQDALRARYYQLEDEFFHHGKLDPDAWHDLANQFERRDRPHSPTVTRRHLAIFQQIISGEYQPDYYHSSEEYIQQQYDSP